MFTFGLPSRLAAGDPYWNYVVLLLSFNGTNGSRDIVDSSSYARTVTAVGTCNLSSTQKKFGDTSCFLNDGWAAVDDAAVMELGSQNWTIEFWQYVSNTNGGFAKDTVGQGDSGVYPIAFDLVTVSADRRLRVRLSSNGTAYDFDNTWPSSGHGFAFNTWQHIAICRDGNTIALYVEGIQQGSATYSNTVSNNSQQWSFGKAGTYGSYYSSGYVDELRMTVGACRYTSNFTPPTAPFPVG